MKGMIAMNDSYVGGEQKTRIIQELVPGKQITLAHIIANPDKILYRKLGLDPAVDYSKSDGDHCRRYRSEILGRGARFC